VPGVLKALAAQCNGLIWASVSTRDGIEIASVGGAPNEKLSVIVSTMYALSDSIVAEADLGECRSTVLEAGKGRVVILSVPGKTEDLVLAGMATPNTSLGMLLSCCAIACREVTSASPALPDP
jgi:predicted regulator of Ras-like GTPase activity (Roadblock/LC7/MglB family)